MAEIKEAQIPLVTIVFFRDLLGGCCFERPLRRGVANEGFLGDYIGEAKASGPEQEWEEIKAE